MEQVIVIALIMLLGIALVLGIVIPIFKNHSKASDGIVNYDAMMRKFVINCLFQSKRSFAFCKSIGMWMNYPANFK